MMTVISTIASVNLPVYAQSTGDDKESLNDSCRDTGFNDGQNGPFNRKTYDLCGDEANGDKEYYDGFIDGCMSVEGNTRDVCVSSTDGQELYKIQKSTIICAFATVISFILTTSSTVSVYSTVEDDGWVEGDDDSQSEIQIQEELEEA